MEKQGSKQNTANISQHIQRVSNFSLFDVRAFLNIFSDNKSKHFSLSVCVCVCVCVCMCLCLRFCVCVCVCICVIVSLTIWVNIIHVQFSQNITPKTKQKPIKLVATAALHQTKMSLTGIFEISGQNPAIDVKVMISIFMF